MTSFARLLVGPLVFAVPALLVSACSFDDVPVSETAKMDAVPENCAAIKGFGFVQSTLLPKCAGSVCHDAGNTKGVVVLAPSLAYTTTVGVESRALPSMKLVEPGRPSRSFFFRKLSSTQGTACEKDLVPSSQCGGQMPLNDWFNFPEDWIEETRAWIACGAKP
ncbi:hypothetical protein BH11MYX4_BH11MYX4_08450 [soil metagenome]